MSKVLIITGMHRSGTSLITQWLYRCGLLIGEELLESDPGNTEGHFEDKEFLKFHQYSLKKRRLPLSGFINKSLTAFRKKEKAKAKFIIKKRNEQRNEWGWKEPRTVLFLPIYKELIPHAYYLVIIRSFNDTVNSMIAREHKMNQLRFQRKKGLSKLKWVIFRKKRLNMPYEFYAEKFLKVWIHYQEEIIKHTSALSPANFLVVKYEGLHQNDKHVFQTITSQWNFSLAYVPFNSIFKAKMLSKPKSIEPFIKNKKLIEKARLTENKLESLSSL